MGWCQAPTRGLPGLVRAMRGGAKRERVRSRSRRTFSSRILAMTASCSSSPIATERNDRRPGCARVELGLGLELSVASSIPTPISRVKDYISDRTERPSGARAPVGSRALRQVEPDG